MGWLYIIADFSCGEEKIQAVLNAGIDYIQLREKEISSAEYLKRARQLRKMTAGTKTKFIVNDRLDIALLSGADGVHLGQTDIPVKDARSCLGPEKIIGATAKTVEQARQAMREGADYLGSGAWFATETKKDAMRISEEMYRAILQEAPIPNVAVGGITAENARRPLECGAYGLAISAGILKAQDPAKEVAKVRACMEDYCGKSMDARILCSDSLCT
ncbi:MAG: thiamine phosphate synthase [Lachnospiraceae bacterium]|jgi:thiamine-phosphate pyrophosphorylase|nr:thiamine phosphate synthase [Lachnospiraceae bacterium]